jgi:hypothetical protein
MLYGTIRRKENLRLDDRIQTLNGFIQSKVFTDPWGWF